MISSVKQNRWALCADVNTYVFIFKWPSSDDETNDIQLYIILIAHWFVTLADDRRLTGSIPPLLTRKTCRQEPGQLVTKTTGKTQLRKKLWPWAMLPIQTGNTETRLKTKTPDWIVPSWFQVKISSKLNECKL